MIGIETRSKNENSESVFVCVRVCVGGGGDNRCSIMAVKKRSWWGQAVSLLFRPWSDHTQTQQRENKECTRRSTTSAFISCPARRENTWVMLFSFSYVEETK